MTKENSLRCGVLQDFWKEPKRMTTQMKAIKQYFHVVPFIMLCKMVLTLSLCIKP